MQVNDDGDTPPVKRRWNDPIDRHLDREIVKHLIKVIPILKNEHAALDRRFWSPEQILNESLKLKGKKDEPSKMVAEILNTLPLSKSDTP